MWSLHMVNGVLLPSPLNSGLEQPLVGDLLREVLVWYEGLVKSTLCLRRALWRQVLRRLWKGQPLRKQPGLPKDPAESKGLSTACCPMTCGAGRKMGLVWIYLRPGFSLVFQLQVFQLQIYEAGGCLFWKLSSDCCHTSVIRHPLKHARTQARTNTLLSIQAPNIKSLLLTLN